MPGNYSKQCVNDLRLFTKQIGSCLCPSLPAMFPFGKVLFCLSSPPLSSLAFVPGLHFFFAMTQKQSL